MRFRPLFMFWWPLVWDYDLPSSNITPLSLVENMGIFLLDEGDSRSQVWWRCGRWEAKRRKSRRLGSCVVGIDSGRLYGYMNCWNKGCNINWSNVYLMDVLLSCPVQQNQLCSWGWRLSTKTFGFSSGHRSISGYLYELYVVFYQGVCFCNIYRFSGRCVV